MCRMLAFASDEPRDMEPYLGHLARLSARGNLVDRWEKRPGGNHPDGWGVAFRRGGEILLDRSGKPAAEDPSLLRIRGSADRFLGHARYASDTETVDAENSHPFLVRGIALAHNGTFRGRIGEDAQKRKVSDSLVFLEMLADRWTDRTLSGLGEAMTGLLQDEELVGRYSAANMLIAAGEAVFALRNYRKDADYYTLYLREDPGLAVAASEPLTPSGRWRLLENGELVDMDPSAPRSLLLAVPRPDDK